MNGTNTTSALRIAVVAACPFPSARGSQVLIRELAEGLASRGHEVHIVAYPVGEHLVPVRGIVVHRPRWLTSGRMERLPWLVRKSLWDVLLVMTLCRVVRAKKIQLLHAHNYEGLFVACVAKWLLGCPLVYHAHNVLNDELPTYFRKRWSRWLMGLVGEAGDRLVPRLADVAVVLSAAQRDALLSRGLPPDRIIVVPPPVPDLGEGAARSRTNVRMPAGEFVVGYAGNLDAYQDLGVLVRAFCWLRERHSAAALLLVTHDRDWTRHAPRELLALVGRPEVKVVVCRSFAETRPWLSGADVLVCPRGSWSGFPIKLLNFASLQKPIVLSAAVAKAIGWSHGATVFQAGNEADLASVLLRLAENPSARAGAADAASRFANGLPSLEMVSEALERLMSWTWWLKWRGVRRLTQIPEHRWGVDSHVPTSYKPADGRREDEARA
ncbi:D-inositol-3-phosphate glycosyltransferase [bacterium HR30]|nr:D-inositol-3-phosphate glycosyltransferase [bacterium HR30]